MQSRLLEWPKNVIAGNKAPMRSKIDAAKSPPRIELSGPKKAMIYGIFRLDGDELTTCVGRTQPQPEYEKALVDTSDEFCPEAGTLIIGRRVKQ